MYTHGDSTVTAARCWYELGLISHAEKAGCGALVSFKTAGCIAKQHDAVLAASRNRSVQPKLMTSAPAAMYASYKCSTYDRFTISCHEMRRFGAHDIVLTDPG